MSKINPSRANANIVYEVFLHYRGRVVPLLQTERLIPEDGGLREASIVWSYDRMSFAFELETCIEDAIEAINNGEKPGKFGMVPDSKQDIPVIEFVKHDTERDSFRVEPLRTFWIKAVRVHDPNDENAPIWENCKGEDNVHETGEPVEPGDAQVLYYEIEDALNSDMTPNFQSQNIEWNRFSDDLEAELDRFLRG